MNPIALALPILVSLMSFATGAEQISAVGVNTFDGSACMLNYTIANGRVMALQYRGLFIDQNQRPLLRRQVQFGGNDLCFGRPLQFPIKPLKNGSEVVIPSVCANFSIDSDYEREQKLDRVQKRTRYEVAIFGDLKKPTGFVFQESSGETQQNTSCELQAKK